MHAEMKGASSPSPVLSPAAALPPPLPQLALPHQAKSRKPPRLDVSHPILVPEKNPNFTPVIAYSVSSTPSGKYIFKSDFDKVEGKRITPICLS